MPYRASGKRRVPRVNSRRARPLASSTPATDFADDSLYTLRNVSSASTTSRWSSSWGRPETVTVPMTPAPSTAIGNEPPWAAYVSGSRREDSSKVVPLARKRAPTR